MKSLIAIALLLCACTAGTSGDEGRPIVPGTAAVVGGAAPGSMGSGSGSGPDAAVPMVDAGIARPDLLSHIDGGTP